MDESKKNSGDDLAQLAMGVVLIAFSMIAVAILLLAQVENVLAR